MKFCRIFLPVQCRGYCMWCTYFKSTMTICWQLTKKFDGQSKKLIGSVGGWCFVGNSQIIVLRCLTHVKSFRNIYRISRDSQTNKNQIKCKKNTRRQLLESMTDLSCVFFRVIFFLCWPIVWDVLLKVFNVQTGKNH